MTDLSTGRCQSYFRCCDSIARFRTKGKRPNRCRVVPVTVLTVLSGFGQEEAATLRAQALLERKKCEQLRSEIQVGADFERLRTRFPAYNMFICAKVN